MSRPPSRTSRKLASDVIDAAPTITDMLTWTTLDNFQHHLPCISDSAPEAEWHHRGVSLPPWIEGVQEVAQEFSTTLEDRLAYVKVDPSVTSLILHRSSTTSLRSSSVNVPALSVRAADSRQHKKARAHLFAWLFRRKSLCCALTHRSSDSTPLLHASPSIHPKTPHETRIQEYRAIGGWFCNRSHLIYLILMGTENVLWDLHQFLVFFIEETVLDAVEKYIDFLEEWESDDSHLAIDWFSYLRMRHPNLCQGRQCEIRLIPKINAPPITRVLEDGSRDTRFPPFFQCYTLTRPLFLLLRRTETLDSTGSSDWGAWHRERLKWDGWNSWFNEHWPRTPEAIRPQCIQFILLATRLRYRMDVYVQWRRGQGVYSRPPTYVPPDDQSPSPARLIVEEWHRLQATCTYEEEGEEGN